MPHPDQNPLRSHENLDALHQRISGLLAAKIIDVRVFRGELTISTTIEQIVSVLTLLRDEAGGGFTQLTDLTAVDYPNRTKRFTLIYQMLSVTLNRRVRVEVAIKEGTVAPSVTQIFSSANWSEREVWDMYGIFFDGHNDLRRLLTDYGFEGHPLRKDFPLTGNVEVRYDESERRVVYEPVELTQEYRDFDTASPWEGTQTSMRQDESPRAPDQDRLKDDDHG